MNKPLVCHSTKPNRGVSHAIYQAVCLNAHRFSLRETLTLPKAQEHDRLDQSELDNWVKRAKYVPSGQEEKHQRVDCHERRCVVDQHHIGIAVGWTNVGWLEDG